MTQKSPEAFRTISEVAAELDVPQHVLRFWETKFNQIKPLKRGGGRRYYRPEDIDLLRGIRTLLYHDGYTIKGVQKVFRENGVRYVAETGRAELEAELAAAGGGGDVVDMVAPEAQARPAMPLAPVEPRQLTEDEQDSLERILAELEGLKTRLEKAREWPGSGR